VKKIKVLGKEISLYSKKEEEFKQLGWDIRRNLTKINYRIHTDAIKENLIPPELLLSQHFNSPVRFPCVLPDASINEIIGGAL
jgi:hypothetical protein